MTHAEQATFFSATIYGDNAVGITFKPTPDITYSDLIKLIRELEMLKKEMRS